MNNLGLNDMEALEYVLMLSREESRQGIDNGSQDDQNRIGFEEGLFDGDVTDPSSAPRVLQRNSQSRTILAEKSNRKIQTLPVSLTKPMEAGATSKPFSPGSNVFPNEAHFPHMASSSPNRKSNLPSGSPKSVRSAWSNPLSLSQRVLNESSLAMRGEEMDQELHIAVELSLAEARCRGEDI